VRKSPDQANNHQSDDRKPERHVNAQEKSRRLVMTDAGHDRCRKELNDDQEEDRPMQELRHGCEMNDLFGFSYGHRPDYSRMSYDRESNPPN
jgi:hypothetical protein